MKTITLVTGNAGKLAEWQRLWPLDIELVTSDIDLDEIQSLDTEAIVIDKARRAFEHIDTPVIVEDVSAGLDKLGGLPGSFIKFFEQQLGRDALYRLATMNKDFVVTVRCVTAYYDGTNLLTARGEIHGTAVATAGDRGFGFDKNFMPVGSRKTFGQMSLDEKDAISHRAQAVTLLAEKLAKL
jgi:non-canonical purine NTP pyrophosphatase (RdgB/HAM1 family)